MPKPFKVLLEVEEAALGQVMHALDRMPGVINFIPLMDHASERRATNGHGNAGSQNGKPRRHPSGISALVFLMRLLAKKGALSRQQIVEAFKQDGRSGSSSYTAGYDLKKVGLATGDAAAISLTAKGRDRVRRSA